MQRTEDGNERETPIYASTVIITSVYPRQVIMADERCEVLCLQRQRPWSGHLWIECEGFLLQSTVQCEVQGKSIGEQEADLCL